MDRIKVIHGVCTGCHLMVFTASYVNVMVDDLGLSTDEYRKTKASLSTYNDVREWHLRATGSLPPHASVGNCLKFKSVEKIFSLLGNRYNMAQKVNINAINNHNDNNDE
jgi:hypothetical protein